MFGPRITTVFKSRWNALLWAGSIMLLAYCSVPSREETEQAAAQRKNAGEHVNPWAKTPE